MKIKQSILTSAATVFVIALTFMSTISTSNAGGMHSLFGGSGRISDGGRGGAIQPIVEPIRNAAVGNRGGLDDPANHDAGDNRRGNQTGDDRGRHHGQRRGR